MTNSDGRAGPLINEILRSIAREYEWPEYLPAALEEVEVPPETLSTYAGRYKIATDNVLTVRVDGNRLEASETEGGEFELIPISETKFVRQDRKLEYEFFSSGLLAGQVRVTGAGPGGQAGFLIEDVETVPQELLRSGRVNEAMDGYRALKRADPQEPAVSEQRLNNLGYTLLGEKKMAEAIAVFKLNAEFYPGSFNVYDSLGEAYMIDGQKELAIRNYDQSVRINRENANGIAMLKKLRGK
jgi:tetratricopeptide (TPR) repeat protein